MLFKKICPRCANVLSKKDDVCPECGYSFASAKEDEETKVLKFSSDIEPETDKPEEQEKPQEQALKAEETIVTTPEENANNDQADSNNNTMQQEGKEAATNQPKRHKHKKKNRKQKIDLDVEIDKDGEYNIDTRDVTFFEGASDSYTTKEKKQNKPKWWEIYRWADIYFARKKINKEVNKAALEMPAFISKTWMLILCLLFGWMGAHNYYAKNYKKAAFVTISVIIAFVVANVKVFEGVIQISVGGGLGFIALFMWVWDFIGILINKYKYRESKLKFISKLNAKTREKLGQKYLNIHDWFVPYEEKLKNKRLKQAKIKRFK